MNTPQNALVITCHSAVGQQLFAALESRHIGAPCAADSGGAPVWAEQRTPTTVSRVFEATPALAALIGSGTVELAIGVTASVAPRLPSAVSYQGAGAHFWAVMQSTPGLRRQAFPPLPTKWARAIERAACGERLS